MRCADHGTWQYSHVEFGVLGEIEVRAGGRPVDLGPARRRCVLAALLVDVNQAVRTDQLVDRVWGDRPPAQARTTLSSYLTRLRQVLGDTPLTRRSGGYVLTADPASVDLHHFRDLVARARATADDAKAAELLDEALGLWRGEAFAGLDTPWINAVRGNLDDERRAAERDRTDVQLRLGRHSALLPSLTAQAEAQPLDERLAGQLMLAQYRGGRRADALETYRRVRALLGDELGVDPSPPLQELHQRILAADQALTPAETTLPVPRQLPAAPSQFTGRARELRLLDDGTAPITVIGGTGGMGKTWLALHWAHRNLDRFPDGQLYVNLSGFAPSGEPLAPETAVRGFLDALGVPPTSVPADSAAQAGLYRSLVAGKRMLIVLDNARDTDQVTPLLPGTSDCTVLVTSRRQLGGLVTAHGAKPLPLKVLSEPEARELLELRLHTNESAALAELLRQCAGLPLALGIIAARAAANPDFPLSALAEELRDETAKMAAFDAGEATVNLRAVFSWSSQHLEAPDARMFRLLSLHPGPDFSAAAAASLAGVRLDEARASLGTLTGAHLLTQPAPGRFALHDLLRAYSASLPDDDRDDAALRLLDHYLHTAQLADQLLFPHRDRLTPPTPSPGMTLERLADDHKAWDWFRAERPALLTLTEQAANTGFGGHAWRIHWNLVTFLQRSGLWHDLAANARTALAAATRTGDSEGQAQCHISIAYSSVRLTEFDDAHAHLGHALELRAGDRIAQADIHLQLDWACGQQGRNEEALTHALEALRLYQAEQHESGQALALNDVGWYHANLGTYTEALTYCDEALRLHRKLGNRVGEAATSDSVGYAHHHLGHHEQAVSAYLHAISLYHELGDRYGVATALTHLADTHSAAGEPALARDCVSAALDIFESLRHPRADETRTKLRGLDAAGSGLGTAD
ncbi:BTAD domain-containing putative transcriptional regulator [Amycolatopsis sp. cg5]|uniref:AfsR/SARP family transcriptional regulator n=1 Tax=Amycolatopsis sp. cg5 TaxID=3238802 RepID=UPI0035269068